MSTPQTGPTDGVAATTSSTTSSTAAAAHALAETAAVLRQLAGFDGGTDASRGAITANLAGLVDTIGRNYHALPSEVGRSAMAVVAAVDRAIGHRRS